MLGHGVGQGGGLRIHALAALTFVGAGGFGLAAGLVLDVGLLGASRGFFLAWVLSAPGVPSNTVRFDSADHRPVVGGPARSEVELRGRPVVVAAADGLPVSRSVSSSLTASAARRMHEAGAPVVVIGLVGVDRRLFDLECVA
jgi:hypothetical protein